MKTWNFNDKRHLYKTAKVIGLNRCYVSVRQWNEDTDKYLCVNPFGKLVWFDASELEDFGL